MRRYQRNLDQFQIKENLLELLSKMKILLFPAGVNQKKFKQLLFAVQHNQRKPATKSRSGRRAAFEDSFLENATIKLKTVLLNETKGRISLPRFISTYLPSLDYPPDLRTALDAQIINLEEARILARVNFQSLGATNKREPALIRKELIESHLKRNGTQSELAGRVAEVFGTTKKAQADAVTSQVITLEGQTDELLEFTEFDTEHLLWEEIKSLVYLVRELDPKLIDDFTLDEILGDIDTVKLKLMKIRKEHQKI